MKLALTFDDGVGSITESLLDLLAEYDAKASFFCLGERAQHHPEVLKRMVAEGHTVGGHHFTHINSMYLDLPAFEAEVAHCLATLEVASGSTVVNYRPPYGVVSHDQQQYLAKQGLTTVYWSVDTKDWCDELNSTEYIVGQIMMHAKENGVILCHDAGGSSRMNTLHAMKVVIPQLMTLGYELVNVEQLNIDEVNQASCRTRGVIVPADKVANK